ncbi:terpene synthase family protein [Actinoallomurus sp. NPDC050550]|uniref:terpene synthase family protein n=1 Tax=Actinoallomurus sp. NPDC050550 TaxID=3154937 RepID=UPI0033F1EBA3
MPLSGSPTAILPAAESGRVCAVASRAQCEVREWSARYDGLFGAKPFDLNLFNMVCFCTAFSAPWLGSAALRMTNRVAVWSFGADWLIDYVATSQGEVSDLVARCLAVADGAPPDADDLTRGLADIRNGLASSAAFPALREVWREELRRFLDAMAREWDWNAARADGSACPPSFEEYLGNTDNLGFSFAFVSHWIATSPPPPAADIAGIVAASREAQRTMRLINDLGTYERDVSWGDLNALMLDVTEQQVREHLTAIGGRFRTLLDPLRADHPQLASYMERQVDFYDAFLGLTDYWGAL